MATDLEAELSKKNLPLPGAKPTLQPDSVKKMDRHIDRRSSYTGPPTSGTLNASKEAMKSQCAAAERIPGFQASGFDIFKKIRRAERFGIPVYLSEAEKRYSRAERFGIVSACGSYEMAKGEELKRMARAERFELSTLSVATDEEAKKKARLARFAPFL